MPTQGCNRCMYTWEGEGICPICGQPSTHDSEMIKEKEIEKFDEWINKYKKEPWE